MERIAGLLGRYRNRGSLGAAVGRATVIAEAQQWLDGDAPRCRGRFRVTSIIGRQLTAQADAGIVAAELRLRGPRLLAHLRERFPGYPLDGLKCFIAGSRLSEDRV